MNSITQYSIIYSRKIARKAFAFKIDVELWITKDNLYYIFSLTIQTLKEALTTKYISNLVSEQMLSFNISRENVHVKTF